MREVSEPPKMGETTVLRGCSAQNLHAGPRWCLLGARVEVTGVAGDFAVGCKTGGVFLTRYFFSCVWQYVGERHLQSVCNPWLKVLSQLLGVSVGDRGGSLPICDGPHFHKEGGRPVFLAGRVLFQVQGDHRSLASPGSHQEGSLQELCKTCVLPHVQKFSFVSSSFSPAALGRLGGSSARKQSCEI